MSFMQADGFSDSNEKAFQEFLDRNPMLANGQYDELWYVDSDEARSFVAKLQKQWPGYFEDHKHPVR